MHDDGDEGIDKKTIVGIGLVALLLSSVGGFYAMNGGGPGDGGAGGVGDDDDSIDYQPKELPAWDYGVIPGGRDAPDKGIIITADLPWTESDDNQYDCAITKVFDKDKVFREVQEEHDTDIGTFLIDYHGNVDEKVFEWENSDGEEYKTTVSGSGYGITSVIEWKDDTEWRPPEPPDDYNGSRDEYYWDVCASS